MAKEVEEGSIFVLADDVAPAASNGGIDTLSVCGNNCTDGEEANDAPNLLLGCT